MEKAHDRKTAPDDEAIRQAAAALGRLGGLKGGPARAAAMPAAKRQRIAKKAGKVGGIARAAAMTPEERSESSRRAVQARWDRIRAEKAAQEKAAAGKGKRKGKK